MNSPLVGDWDNQYIIQELIEKASYDTIGMFSNRMIIRMDTEAKRSETREKRIVQMIDMNFGVPALRPA